MIDVIINGVPYKQGTIIMDGYLLPGKLTPIKVKEDCESCSPRPGGLIRITKNGNCIECGRNIISTVKEIKMEPVDIREKDYDLARPGDPGMKGKEIFLNDEILNRLGLNSAKLKDGQEFIGTIKLKVAYAGGNCAGIEITHLAIEPEKKEKSYVSSR